MLADDLVRRVALEALAPAFQLTTSPDGDSM
jgi:hypothetical protein